MRHLYSPMSPMWCPSIMLKLFDFSSKSSFSFIYLLELFHILKRVYLLTWWDHCSAKKLMEVRAHAAN